MNFYFDCLLNFAAFFFFLLFCFFFFRPAFSYVLRFFLNSFVCAIYRRYLYNLLFAPSIITPVCVVLHGTAQIPVGKAQNQAQNEPKQTRIGHQGIRSMLRQQLKSHG